MFVQCKPRNGRRRIIFWPTEVSCGMFFYLKISLERTIFDFACLLNSRKKLGNFVNFFCSPTILTAIPEVDSISHVI